MVDSLITFTTVDFGVWKDYPKILENGTITPQMLQASLDVCLDLDDEMFEAEDKPVVPRYVYHATPHAYWEQIKEQGGMTPQIGYMTYRAFLPVVNAKAHIGQDISPEHYKQWLVKELEGLKIWATTKQGSGVCHHDCTHEFLTRYM